MEPLKNDSFGLLIAYVLPGFVALSATAFYSETVRSWLGASSSFSPSVGGFLYVTLASTALGLLISTIRWAVIDRLHHATGIREPKWDFSTLQRNFAAFIITQRHAHPAARCEHGTLLALNIGDSRSGLADVDVRRYGGASRYGFGWTWPNWGAPPGSGLLSPRSRLGSGGARCPPAYAGGYLLTRLSPLGEARLTGRTVRRTLTMAPCVAMQ